MLMQIKHADQAEETSAAIRGGDREFKTLLVGDENSPDNFRLVLARQSGKVVAPRHKHNFDQIRMCLSGEGQNYGPDRWIRPGEIVYFPEGVPYGPEDSDCQRFGITLQFGGASGNGFLSSRHTKQGMEELKQFGTFEKGVFFRSGDLAPGQRRNQDSFEAVWEHINQRNLEYPKPRYDEPVLMRPQNFEGQQTDQPGVSIKPLGCFTERRIEISMLELDPGARGTIAARPGRQVAFLTSGAGRVEANEVRQYSAIALDSGETAHLNSPTGMEILLIGLPIFAQQVRAISNAA
jgi:quercetin dioxygenase-like cupin family protein